MERILTAVKLFSTLEFDTNDYSSLPFELALVDYNLSSVADKPAAAKPAKPKPLEQVKETAIPPIATPKKKQPEVKTEAVAESSLSVEAVKTSPPEANDKLAYLVSNWKHIIEQAPENTKRTAAIAILRSAGVQPVSIDGDTIVLTFKYLYHKEKIEEIENRKTTADIISNFLGHACQIRCVYEAEENHLVREAQKLGAKITNVEEK